MAQIRLLGQAVRTVGSLPKVGSPAPDFELIGTDLAPIRLSELRGRRVVLNIFLSVGATPCNTTVLQFNRLAAGAEDTTILCVSRDLPQTMAQFCGTAGIKSAHCASGFRATFGTDYGVEMADGPLRGVYSRAVLVIEADGTVSYAEQVDELGDEPDYDAVLSALTGQPGSHLADLPTSAR